MLIAHAQEQREQSQQIRRRDEDKSGLLPALWSAACFLCPLS